MKSQTGQILASRGATNGWFDEIDGEIRVTSYKGNIRTGKIQPKWELVGTHTGRRTFIVNALSLGITPNIVMKWTGHSDYKAM